MEGFDQFVRAFVGQEPTGVVPDFVPITAGRTYLMGTPIISLGGRQAKTESGLYVVLFGEDAPIPFIGIYMTLSEYSEDAQGIDKTELAAQLPDRLGRLDRTSLLRSLGQLWEWWNHQEARKLLVESYVKSLNSDESARVRNLLDSGPERRVFLSKQLIVQAMAEALRVQPDENASVVQHLREVVEICHLVAEKFGPREPTGDPIVLGTPEFDEFALSLTSNAYFNSTEDDLARMVRAWRLWNSDSPRIRGELGGNSPAEVFKKVTNYTIDVHFALMISLYIQICPGGVQKSVINSPKMIQNYESAYLDFLSELTTDARDEKSCLVPAESEWDIGILHSNPLIQIAANEFVVTNHDNVMNRTTTDLIYKVSPKVSSESGLHKNALMNAWGYVIEDYVLDSLMRICAFAKLQYWTDDDIAALYPGKDLRRPDLVLLDGDRLIVVEVMKRGLAGTVQKSQDVNQYRRELQLGVFEKCNQLSESFRYILENPSRLGIGAQTSIGIPLIVSGSGLSLNRVLQAEIEKYCQEKGLFGDQRIRRPVCTDLGEIEMLEALVERGASPALTVLHWFGSEFSSTSLKNYIVTLRRDKPEDLRSTSLKDSFDEMVKRVMSVIESA